MAIPQDVREHFGGKTAYIESLQTSDLRVARDKRDMIEREVVDHIKALRNGSIVSDVVAEAERFGRISREALNTTHSDDERGLIIEGAEETSERLRGAAKSAFEDAWSGRQPVDKYVAAWLKEVNLAEKTTKEKAGLIRQVAEWCKAKGYLLPDITRRTAGEYVAECIAPRHRRTAKKHMAALVGYWDYLLRRGKVPGDYKTDNPWKDQLEPMKRRQGVRADTLQERPFTDEELSALLYIEGTRKHDKELRELTLISALSGMRIGEITSLSVANCRNDRIDLSRSKTTAGVRTLPLHSKLKALLMERMEGKNDNDLIFHEFIRMPNASDTMGKAFAKRRADLKIDDTVEGRRRSLVNFHSLRKTFVTKARHAGWDEATIADIVGHDTGKKTMTFGSYTPTGASWEQKRECVEAVKVPERMAGGDAVDRK